MTAANGSAGPLRRRLEEARLAGLSMDESTVLAAQNDPYRRDTKAGHRDAAWLAEQLERAIGSTRRIHLRGLHYAIVAAGNVLKPNGKPLVSSRWPWAEQTAALRAHKSYAGEDGEE